MGQGQDPGRAQTRVLPLQLAPPCQTLGSHNTVPQTPLHQPPPCSDISAIQAIIVIVTSAALHGETKEARLAAVTWPPLYTWAAGALPREQVALALLGTHQVALAAGTEEMEEDEQKQPQSSQAFRGSARACPPPCQGLGSLTSSSLQEKASPYGPLQGGAGFGSKQQQPLK